MLGQRVNNFEIVRLLGEGGMGAVYEAKHLMIRRRVAVKVLRPELALDPETVLRFFNEARATSAIRHPNIVEVVDVGTLPDGVPFLVMELLEGESLADRLERTPRLEIPMALEFVRQAANALQAAHESGIVHRDLKPENLFLVPDQRFPERELVKVLDFGIAKLLADISAVPVNTVAGAVFGTPPYMSPEQCRESSSGVDRRTDIYALGIILYETLCGQLPFEAESIGSLMLLHMSEAPVPPTQLRADVPAHVERAILKALEKNRDDRFADMAEFRDALGPSPLPILKIVSDGEDAEPRATSVTEVTLRTSPAAAGGAPHGGNAPALRGGAPHGGNAPALRGGAPHSGNAPALRGGAPHGGNAPALRGGAPHGGNAPALRGGAALDAGTRAQASLLEREVAHASAPAVGDAASPRSPRARTLLALALLVGAALIGAWFARPEPPQTARVNTADATVPFTASPAPLGELPNAAGTPATLAAPQQAAPAPASSPAGASVAAGKTPAAERAKNGADRNTAQRAPRHARIERSAHDAPALRGGAPHSGDEPALRGGAPHSGDEPALRGGASLATSTTQAPLANPAADTNAGADTAAAPPSAAIGEPGYLSLDSAPWSDVYLGNKLLGTTPLIHVAMPPGKHLLTLKNSELGRSTSYAVEIQSGKTLSRLVGWESVK